MYICVRIGGTSVLRTHTWSAEQSVLYQGYRQVKTIRLNPPTPPVFSPCVPSVDSLSGEAHV